MAWAHLPCPQAVQQHVEKWSEKTFLHEADTAKMTDSADNSVNTFQLLRNIKLWLWQVAALVHSDILHAEHPDLAQDGCAMNVL